VFTKCGLSDTRADASSVKNSTLVVQLNRRPWALDTETQVGSR